MRRRTRLRPSAEPRRVHLDLDGPLDDEGLDELSSAPVPDGAGSPSAAGSPGAGGAAGGDAEAGDAGPGDAEAGDAGPGDGSRRDARRRRRVTVGVAGALALLLGGMVAVDVVGERVAQQRVADSPGGIRSLAGAPEPLWSVSHEGWAFSVLPGLVVLHDDHELVALDVDAGDEQWRVDVGGPVDCQRQWWSVLRGGAVEEELVCVGGYEGGGGPFVVVVAADGGVVARRDLDPTRGTAAPGPPGTLVRAGRVGEPVDAGELVYDTLTGQLDGTVGGRDVAVALEDAATGDLLWEDTVRFESTDGDWGCLTWTEAGDPEPAPDDVEAAAADGVVQVQGCGVRATYTAAGTRLDDPDDLMDDVVPLADGGYARTELTGGNARSTTLLAEDGSPRGRVPADLLQVVVNDGREPGLLLARSGHRIQAFDAAGTQLWQSAADRRVDSVLAQVGGTVVFSSGEWLVALDLTDGARVWEERGPAEHGAAHQAVTDGRSLVVASVPFDGESLALRVLALDDGREVWPATEVAPSWGTILSIESRLFAVTQDALIRIG